MRALRMMVAASLLTVLAAGCSNDGATPSGGATQSAASATTTTSPPVKDATDRDFDRGRFSDPTTIDNRWFPMEPGMQLTLDGRAVVDDERVRRRVVFTVTDLTKEIAGVTARVAWDRDYTNDELVESELAFFAQDDDGNVWHLGQYPEEYEEGKLAAAPAWITGVEGARAGIAMRAAPRLGSSDYAQGYAPKVQWFDRAKVDQMALRDCVRLRCYEDVLVMDEYAADEPAAHQLKYYAQGVGNIRVGWRGQDEEQETLELIRFARLDAAALAEVRKEALALDRRAYVNSKNVYGQTKPAR